MFRQMFVFLSVLFITTSCFALDDEAALNGSVSDETDAQEKSSLTTTMSKEERLAFVDDLLPTGKVEADIFKVVTDPAAAKVAQKLKTFFATHSSWVSEQLENREPSESLPYHKDMGITEEEYKNFLSASGLSVQKTRYGSTTDLEKRGRN